jgi:hypothetical protein
MHFDRLSSAPVLQVIAAGAVGLLVAPGVLARDDLGPGGSARRSLAAQGTGWQELVWLSLAVLVVGWLAALFPALSRALDRRLEGLPIRSAHALADLPLLTHLALGACYVVLIQAVLRRPLVLTLGPAFERFVVEATFAAAMLLLLFGLLVALHRTGRPLVSGLAWLALDTAFATSGPTLPLAEPVTRANGATQQRLATTVAAPGPNASPASTQPATEPTLAATQPGAPAANGQPAMPARAPKLDGPRPTLGPPDGEATVASGDGQQMGVAS